MAEVFASTRAISGTDTPVKATDDGGRLRVTADCVVTLTATSWTVGRSAIAFDVVGSSTALTFTEGAGVTIVAANGDETVDVQYQSCVAVYDSANTWVVHKAVDPSDFDAAGAAAAAQAAAEATAAAALTAHEADTTGVHGIADTSALLDTADIGVSVQAYDAVLDATTASFTTADETKLDGIETGATADQTGAQIKAAYEAEADTNAFDDAAVSKLAGIEAAADVTDPTNVAAAGAHMAGGTDVPVADGGTGASNASDARTNLGVAIGSDVQAYDASNATTSTRLDQFATPTADIDMGDVSLLQVGAIESRVNTVASSGSTEALDVSEYAVHDVTMSENCTFTFTNPAASGEASTFSVIIRGAFTPTLPGAIDWDGGSAPTYASPSEYSFTTVDGGTTWLGKLVGSGYA